MQKVREELLKQIETIEKTLDIKKKELADIEQAIKTEDDKKPFFPKYGEDYYYANADGKVFKTMFFNCKYTDKIRVESGNCFRTEEKAQEYAQKVLEVFSDRLKKPTLKIMSCGFEICRGILGEEISHIIYEDGSIAHVGDIVSVQLKNNTNDTNDTNTTLFVFKDIDDGRYTNGAVMGYAEVTRNSDEFNNSFMEDYIIKKIMDYSEIEAGFKYKYTIASYVVVEEEK